MKKFLIEIKNNLMFILIPIIFFSFLLININVTYYGDDYYYLSFSDLSVQDFFAKHIEHYNNDNGRFIVHILVTIFLKLPMPFWQIFNSLMLTGICYFATRILTTKNDSKKPFILTLLFFFIASLSIQITRQSVYWLTGSFNYVYPIFLLFCYWFCLSKIESKKYFILSIILGFLAAASMEQSAMMTLGLTLLTFLTKFKNIKDLKNLVTISKQNLKLIILSIITLIGVCTVVLAPAQFVRIDKEQQETSTLDTIKNNSFFMIRNYFDAPSILPYCILFNAFIILFACKQKEKSKIFIILSCSLNILLSLINIYLVQNYDSFIISRLIILLGILITYSINFIYINKKIFSKLISPLTISLILKLGSQLMMLISPVFGPRNLIFGLIMFAFIICIIAKYTDLKYLNSWTTLMFVIALLTNSEIAQGYLQTRLIDEKNIEIISQNIDTLSDENKELTLFKFPSDDYCWSMPYISKYHEFWFKNNYAIKNKINWEYPL